MNQVEKDVQEVVELNKEIKKLQEEIKKKTLLLKERKGILQGIIDQFSEQSLFQGSDSYKKARVNDTKNN